MNSPAIPPIPWLDRSSHAHFPVPGASGDVLVPAKEAGATRAIQAAFAKCIIPCFIASPFRERDYLHLQDLVDPEIRRHHLEFNEHLHSCFGDQRFVQVKGELGYYVAFRYSTCKEVMNDHASFSSNPFPDGRLVALNTMAKEDHGRVLRYVHKHYTKDAINELKGDIQEVIEKCTGDLASGKALVSSQKITADDGRKAMISQVDGVKWAQRIHMSGTLARLGLKLSWEKVDEIVDLNDAMVALVAPLGGVGQETQVAFQLFPNITASHQGLPNERLPWTWLLQVALGLLRSVPSLLLMAAKLGVRCTWQIIRPDVNILNPPRKPRMGLWWKPELLHLVPRYFLLLHRLLYKEDSKDGPLSSLREAVASGNLSLAECLTLMVQLMVNMTSANALCSLLFRLSSEKEAAKKALTDVATFGDAFIQEVLRLDAPLQRNPRRCVQPPTKGKTPEIGPKEGNQVLLFLGAANMDPTVFTNPKELDREETPLLTFGSGLHYCLGSSLVKLEMRMVLEHLAKFKSIALDDGYERIADVDVGNWGFRHLPDMETVQEYITQLMRGRNVTVKETTDRGRGLFATNTPPAVGGPAMLFSEASLGGIVQMSGSARKRGGACFLCGHVLGSPAWQLRLLTGKVFESSDDVLEEPLSDIVEGKPLFWKRTPLFCSAACHAEYERILGRLRARRTAAQRFAQYARKVQCAFHMLALKLICWCLAETSTRSSAEAAAPLQALCRRPYWDALDMPENTDVETFKKKLAKETETSRRLALEALGGRDVLPPDWDFLDEDGYANLLGALCCNCTVVVYVSPVLQHILQVTNMDDCAAKEAALTALEPWIRALMAVKLQPDESETEKADQEISWNTPSGRLCFSSSILPPFRGYAIYPRMAFMNHSCRPTCAIEFSYSGHIFVLQQPYSEINQDTELTISYLDSSLDAQDDLIAMGREGRRKQLLPYGIHCCSCDLCQPRFRSKVRKGGHRSRPKRQRLGSAPRK
eukprot:symbB.v1.2.013675.t1/scaffold971.1/size148033/3